MDSSYEGSDVELDVNFASASAGTGSSSSTDPTTIPLSARFLPTTTAPSKHGASAAIESAGAAAVGTFHEPVMSLSFEDDDLEDDEDEDAEEEEDDEEDEEEDVQLDNTPAEAAERRPTAQQHRPPPSVSAKSWACKECTFVNNDANSAQCEMCDSSRAEPQQRAAAKTGAAPVVKPSTAATKEAYKKPDPRPPKHGNNSNNANPRPAVESQDEEEDEESDDDDGAKESEEEDELSLDSDKEFDMPAFAAVLLPDSQSMMLSASTLAASATQRVTQSVVAVKPALPLAAGAKAQRTSPQDEDSLVSTDEDEADDWPPVKTVAQQQHQQKTAVEQPKRDMKEAISKETTAEKKTTAATPGAGATPRGVAKRKDKGKEKVDDVGAEDGGKAVMVVASSYDDDSHWDADEERLRKRDHQKQSSPPLPNTNTSKSSKDAGGDGDVKTTKSKSAQSTPAPAAKVLRDFTSFTRNRKKTLTSPPSTPTRSVSPPASSSSSSSSSATSSASSSAAKSVTKTKKRDDDDNDNGDEAAKAVEKAKAERRWISTADKESRKATPARRTAQRKHRVIQSSSEDDEDDDDAAAERERRKKAAEKKKEKEKRNEGEKKKKSKASTRATKKTSPRAEWKEDSDEAEADNHDHTNNSDSDNDNDDGDDQEEERVLKPRAASKAKSKGKEPAGKGEKTTRKAKRKSMEVPDEDAEAAQFTWRKIEKKMLAAGQEATTPKNIDQVLRGFQFIITGLSGDDDKENEDRSAERINRLIGDEGGKVLTNFSNVSLASQCKKRSGYPGFPSTFLLSVKPRTTLKYLLSVAAGLPTVHYNWLIHCCQQRCLLPHSLYLLPAGYSVEKGSDVFIKKPRGDVFEGMRVEVVGSPEFKNLWKLVLKEGGAKVVERLFTPQEARVECIVSPPDPDDYLKVKFKKLGVPVVSKQWVIQSLLSQKMADADNALYNFKNC